MKKSLILFCLFLTITGYSQITVDFQTPNCYLFPVKINNTQTKYFESNFDKILSQNKFSLYNSDGSLYKTISLPSMPDSTTSCYRISHITETLFDNDPSSIEYLLSYVSDSTVTGYSYLVRIAREDGTILLNEEGAILYSNYPYSGSDIDGVHNTQDGTKMLLTYYNRSLPYQTKVFSLPGRLDDAINDESGIPRNTFSVYPNPNNGAFYVKLNSNEENAGSIDLYSINGTLLNSYKSTGKLTHIKDYGLSNGIYLLNTNNKGVNSSAKMVIKK